MDAMSYNTVIKYCEHLERDQIYQHHSPHGCIHQQSREPEASLYTNYPIHSSPSSVHLVVASVAWILSQYHH